MDATRTGRDGDKCTTAHGVELLLEHQSIPSSELVERIALALKKDVKFRNRPPSSSESVSLLPIPSGTLTVLTTFVSSMVPLFLRSFARFNVPRHTPVLKSDNLALSW